MNVIPASPRSPGIAGAANARGAIAPRAGSFNLELDRHRIRLTANGDWTIRQAATLDHDLRLISLPVAPAQEFRGELDVSGIRAIDTAGAWLLQRTARAWAAHGIAARFTGASTEHRLLLDEVGARAVVQVPQAPAGHALTDAIAALGAACANAWAELQSLTVFLGALTSTLVLTLLKPWRFRATSFTHHLEHAGLRAVPIIALICALIGAVIMQQGALQLRYYGADGYAVNMLAVLSLREVGVLLTAIMVAGRSASAFTAEIGAMKMREEIDAMRTLGLDPMETLVLPRVLALMIALPALTFIGNAMCLVGGGVFAILDLGLDWPTYLERTRSAITLEHFFAGMIKTPFAAVIIGMVGCSEGLKVQGNAESLGQHVTLAVVKAIFLVIILDAVFAMFLSSIGV